MSIMRFRGQRSSDICEGDSGKSDRCERVKVKVIVVILVNCEESKGQTNP